MHDTARIINGAFSFSGYITHPISGYISDISATAENENSKTANIFLEATNMTIKLDVNDFQKPKITGSVSQHITDKLNKLEQPWINRKEMLWKKYKAMSSRYRNDTSNTFLKDSITAIQGRIEEYKQRLVNIRYKFINAHPHSYISAYQMQYCLDVLPIDSVRLTYNNFSDAVRTSIYGKLIENYINGSVGSKAKNFISKELNGNVIDLSSFRNKSYVLLDFWASWCSPCRENNLHLIKIYKEYHSAGLEIIGISLDDNDSQAWENAVAKDGISICHNILSGRATEIWQINENDICSKYGVQPIPVMILIDKNGIIIGRYEGDDPLLEKQLAEIFK